MPNDGDEHKPISFNSITQIIFALGTFIFMIFTGYRVFKIVRFTNLLVLNLVIFSCLAMLCSVIIPCLDLTKYKSITYFFIKLKLSVFSITLLINTRLWINHIMVIEEQV